MFSICFNNKTVTVVLLLAICANCMEQGSLKSRSLSLQPAVKCAERHFQDKAVKAQALKSFKTAIAKADARKRRMGTNYKAHQYSLPIASERNVTEFFEETQCRIGDRRTDTANLKSICPWRYEVRHRTDRFPEFITEAKCTCSTCNNLSAGKMSSRFGCIPVFEKKEVLIRTCGVDGVFKWTPGFETISVGCTCSYTYNINV
jgi:hypothetical protein